MNTPVMTLESVRVTGLDALMRALGPVGMIRFLQQFEQGQGDYSVERQQWLDKLSMDDIVEEIQKERQGTSI